MLLDKNDKVFLETHFPGLSILSDNLIEGVIHFSASYDNVTKKFFLNEKRENYITKSYKLRINLYANKFPDVFEINGDLPKGEDYHIYQDGKFCLTHIFFEERYKNKNIKYIIEEFIIPFLYNQTYKQREGEFLWQYGHGFEGTFEYISENNPSKEEYLNTLKSIKNFISKNNKKLFLHSSVEGKKLMFTLKLNTDKSKRGFQKFLIYLRRHTNLFTKI